jgi:hypothetical protein
MFLVSKFEMINSREVAYYFGIQIKRNKGQKKLELS